MPIGIDDWRAGVRRPEARAAPFAVARDPRSREDPAFLRAVGVRATRLKEDIVPCAHAHRSELPQQRLIECLAGAAPVRQTARTIRAFGAKHASGGQSIVPGEKGQRAETRPTD